MKKNKPEKYIIGLSVTEDIYRFCGKACRIYGHFI
jgi:hypothetical protein